MGHNIEVFTGSCYLCKETVEIVKKAKGQDCLLIEQDLVKDHTAITKAKEYGIRTVPTIVMDGEIKIEGKPTLEQVNQCRAGYCCLPPLRSLD